LIYHQRHSASASIESDLATLTQNDSSLAEFQNQVADDMAAGDRALVYKMIGVGLGLVIILSAYLVIMTHKVAGPLYKISMYFDRMAEGRLGKVTALRRGDMLQDFYGNFREMHDSVRTRLQSDLITMESAAAALRTKLGDNNAALEAIDKHITTRKKQLL
jgi:methyl-accepting chemotaxis protein